MYPVNSFPEDGNAKSKSIADAYVICVRLSVYFKQLRYMFSFPDYSGKQ